jgi:N6-adenosine-specific RNA methylase IME4
LQAPWRRNNGVSRNLCDLHKSRRSAQKRNKTPERERKVPNFLPNCSPSVCSEDAAARFAALPRCYFGAILTDVPSRFETWSEKGKGRSAERHYRTEPWEWLRALDVGSLAAPDCVLFHWITWPTLLHQLDLISTWGFTYKTCAFDWCKADVSQIDMFRDDAEPQIGCGYWTRSNTEACLFATRGHPKRLNADVRMAIIEPRREHSRKPDIHDRIERLVAGPYLELFARRPRPDWTVWGNEVTSSPSSARRP